MPQFTTFYPDPELPGQEAKTQMFAPSTDEAQMMLKVRGLGEHIDTFWTLIERTVAPPLELPSELYQQGRIAEALHSACWLGMVAMATGSCNFMELLGDNGVIHGLAHLNLPPEHIDSQNPDLVKKIKIELLQKLWTLESKTPGFTRC